MLLGAPRASVAVALVFGSVLASVGVRAEASYPGANGSLVVIVEQSRGGEAPARTAISRRPGGGAARRWSIAAPRYAWDFSVSADGRRLSYYAGGRRPGVFVADVRGRRPRRLARDGAGPVWSPDGRRLAFWAWRGGFPGEAGSRSRVFVADLVTARVRMLPGTNGSDLAWSPDGRAIAYSGARGLETVPARGGRPRVVFRPRPGRVIVTGVDWSPGGSSLLFGLIDRDEQVFDAPPPDQSTIERVGLNVIRRSGDGLRRIAGRSAVGAVWSPDGRSLALLCGNPAAACVMDRGGRAVRRAFSLPEGAAPLGLQWLPARSGQG